MDVVTHALAGGLVAAAVLRRPSWPAIAAAAGGALAPDLDAVARLWDPIASITVHRTATHSLIGGVPLAAASGAAVKLAWPRARLAGLASFAYLGVLSHIGLDLFNAFGTAVLWPFDSRRFGLGWLYVIDPIAIALVLAGLLLTFRFGRFQRGWARGALVALGVYAAVAGATRSRAEAQFTRGLEARGVALARPVVVPVFPGPLRWMAVADAGDAVYGARFWVGALAPDSLTVVTRPASAPPPGVESLPEVRAFRAFARLPWRTEIVDGDGRIVEYRDLAFEDHPWGGPMALRLRLDASGAVTGIHLGHRF
ncbi:MAG: metal-dependent hydrolase [Candidatus Rokuibacteriota bacterium]